MQAQRYFTNFCFKVSVVLQARLARFVVPGIALVLAVVAVTFVPHLAREAHAVLSAIQHVIAENPWPTPPHASPFV